MKRRLSSRSTFCWKVLFPVAWSTYFGAFSIGLSLGLVPLKGGAPAAGTGVSAHVLSFMFLCASVFGAAFSVWLTGPLKRVYTDGNSLYVSNFLSETTIPLTQIGWVSENLLANIGGKQPILVDLRDPCMFGSRIIFIPTGRAPFSWPWQRKLHPVVQELKSIVATHEQRSEEWAREGVRLRHKKGLRIVRRSVASLCVGLGALASVYLLVLILAPPPTTKAASPAWLQFISTIISLASITAIWLSIYALGLFRCPRCDQSFFIRLSAGPGGWLHTMAKPFQLACVHCDLALSVLDAEPVSSTVSPVGSDKMH